MTTPPAMGVQAPASPVPAPRQVTGMWFSLQIFMMAEISSVLMASMATSGIRVP